MSMATAPASNLAGVLAALGASFVFSINDAAIKFLADDYALHQVVLMRSVVGMVLILAVIVPWEGGYHLLRTRRLGVHLLRGACLVVANMAFFLALAAMPLAEAVAIFFVSPMLITLFSVVFLAERVGPRRWVAVAGGLLGVVIMLRPGTGAFQVAALLPLLAAAAYAVLHTLTRRIGATERAATMAFYIQIAFLLSSLAMGLAFGDGRFAAQDDPSLAFLLRGWVWPAAADWPLIVLVGVSSAMGGFLISQAYRLCEAALVAPFEYVAMPLAIFWGVAIFGEWPDAATWTGIALILGGGLYMIWREAVQGRRIASRRPQAPR
jgi:drug/metabolite transporter (DMT)-like permease